MIPFLKAAFKISLLEASVIVLFGGLKFVITRYHITDSISTPALWIALGAGLLFILAVIANGFVEKSGKSIEQWAEDPDSPLPAKIASGIIGWSMALPILLAWLFFAFLVAPTSLSMLLFLYAGIVIKNCIGYFGEKNKINVENDKTPYAGEDQ